MTPQETIYFLDIITSENGSKEFLLYCPNPVSRKLVVLLAKNLIKHLTEEYLSSYLFRFLKMANYSYSKYSLHFSHYLELLVFMCKFLPEACFSYDLVPNIIKIILNQPVSISCCENKTKDHLKYPKDYSYSNTQFDDPFGCNKTAAIDFVADSLFALNQNTIDYLKSEDGISSFLEIIDSKTAKIAICKLYANLFSGDISNSVMFLNFLFSKFLENMSSAYLSVISVFLNKTLDKTEILKCFLDLYSSFIPQPSVAETLMLLNYLMKMLKNVKFLNVKECFSQDKIVGIADWISKNLKNQENSEDLEKIQQKFLDFVNGKEIDDWDTEDELPDTLIMVGCKIYVYDDYRKKWFLGEVVENLHNELLLIKYNVGTNKIFAFKERCQFGELYYR